MHDPVVDSARPAGVVRALEAGLGKSAAHVDPERALGRVELPAERCLGCAFDDDARPDVEVFGDVVLGTDGSDAWYLEGPLVDPPDFFIDPAAVRAGPLFVLPPAVELLRVRVPVLGPSGYWLAVGRGLRDQDGVFVVRGLPLGDLVCGAGDGSSGDQPVDFLQRGLFGPPGGPEAVQSRHAGGGVLLQRLVAPVGEQVLDRAVVHGSVLHAREHYPSVLLGVMHRVQPDGARQVGGVASLHLRSVGLSHGEMRLGFPIRPVFGCALRIRPVFVCALDWSTSGLGRSAATISVFPRPLFVWKHSLLLLRLGVYGRVCLCRFCSVRFPVICGRRSSGSVWFCPACDPLEAFVDDAPCLRRLRLQAARVR